MNSPTKLTVLIASYKEEELLRKCLTSIRSNVQPMPEIVVVNNASPDGTAEMLSREFPEVKAYRAPENLGFAGGNNYGFPFCTGDYVLLLNDDTIVPRGAFETMCAFLDGHPEAWAVQGKMILTREHNVLDSSGDFLTLFGLQYHYGYRKPDGPKYSVPYPVFAGKGACLMFRRDVPSRTGGFLFNKLFVSYYEETDFCHRIWLCGGQVWFVPSPPIEHLQGVTFARMNQRVLQTRYYRNIWISFLTCFGWPGLLIVVPLFAGLCFFAGILQGKLAWHWEAIQMLWAVRSDVKALRGKLQKLRTAGDFKLFKSIMRTPRLSYFWLSARNRIGEYQD